MHFFPTADAALLSPSRSQQPLPPRPKTIDPIFDAAHFSSPLGPWTEEFDDRYYPRKIDPYAPALIPDEPTLTTSAPYLRAQLTKNERLRLAMLWYYTRDLENEPKLRARLQEKATLAQEATGWELAIVGILDVNVYIRLATVGVELAILPRGESTCSHTVNQTPGNTFHLPDMRHDWRFRESPHVVEGLAAYAGVPLRIEHESGHCVGLGSLCVASGTRQEPLSKLQQQSLVLLGDWVVADIVQHAQMRRQRERQRLAELIAIVQSEADGDDSIEEPVLRILRDAYPDETVTLKSPRADSIEIKDSCWISTSDLKNGIWEDEAFINDFITNSNHDYPPEDTIIRCISARCETRLGSSMLVVATKNFRRIFDDVDAWFVQTCATMLSQRWQKHILSEVMRAKEKFLRGISHQLRTPIHGILGAAELLAEDLKMLTLSKNSSGSSEVVYADKSAVYLDTISIAGRELMSTVNSMITLNRWADIAAAERQYATHDIQSLEMAIVKAMSQVKSRPSVFFHYELPSDCQSLRIDLNLFQNSILPLIVNAIQNTPKGLITVTISLEQDTKTLVVDVQDSGCGIHPDDQERIFYLYEKVGEYSTGAGLGLTLATRFSALLHGSIELVSSEINNGSHFRATFRDVRYTKTLESSPTASKFKHLPLNFHQLVSDSPDEKLSASLVKFLTKSGFTSQETAKDCLLLLDYIQDSEKRRVYLATIPPNHVAICLVPASDETESLQSTTNIIYVCGPYSKSALENALQEADKLLMAIRDSIKNGDGPVQTLHVSPAQDDPSTSPSKPDTSGMDKCPDQRETDGSVGGSSLTRNMNQTPSQTKEFDTDAVVSLTHQLDTTSISKPLSTSPLTPKKSTGPMTLIVDDNMVNLRILEMFCKKRGLPWYSATNGLEAVEIFTKQQTSSAGIELILMDLQMPLCDGISATQQIRSLEKQSGCKPSVLFIVTGQDSQTDREAASAAGADDYLVKPVGMKLLSSSLKKYFDFFKAC